MKEFSEASQSAVQYFKNEDKAKGNANSISTGGKEVEGFYPDSIVQMGSYKNQINKKK